MKWWSFKVNIMATLFFELQFTKTPVCKNPLSGRSQMRYKDETRCDFWSHLEGVLISGEAACSLLVAPKASRM